MLDKKLQDGDSVKKWRARSWKGIYVGQSTVHVSNVPLVYNIATTHVTPQFHLVFDEGLTTVTGEPIANEDKFYEDLYANAKWLHQNDLADSSDLYYFDEFWTDPPVMARDQGRGRKRKVSSLRGGTSTDSHPQSHGSISTLPLSPTDDFREETMLIDPAGPATGMT